MNTLKIMFMGVLALFCINFYPVSCYVDDFEGGPDSDWIYEGAPNWYPDDGAMRSGEIDCTGTSSLVRKVEGAGVVSFLWKKDPVSGAGGKATKYTFSVDGRVQRTCDSLGGVEVRYYLPDDGRVHELRWDFGKISCYPQSMGAGWLDDVDLPGPAEVGGVEIPENVNESIQYLYNNVTGLRADIVVLKSDVAKINATVGELNESVVTIGEDVSNVSTALVLLDGRIVVVEGDVSKINDTIDGLMLDKNVTVLNESWCWNCMNVTGVNKTLERLNQDITIIKGDVTGINATLKDILAEGNLTGINKSFYATLDQMNRSIVVLNENVTGITTILEILYGDILLPQMLDSCQMCAFNRSYNQTVTLNNSTIGLINNYNNTTIYLSGGLYEGPIVISTRDVQIIPKNGSSSVCVYAPRSKECLAIETTSNVSIGHISLCDCNCGIVISNSTCCNIYNNNINYSDECGIYLDNSSNNVIYNNHMGSNGVGGCNIWLNMSNCNYLVKNCLMTNGYYALILDESSHDNLILNHVGCKIKVLDIDRNVECNVSFGSFQCNGNTNIDKNHIWYISDV